MGGLATLRVWRRRVAAGTSAAAAVVAGLVLAALALAVGPTASLGGGHAWAAGDLPVGPHQQFAATVNGVSTSASIRVDCPPGAHRGHALPGQRLGVAIPEVIINPAFGDTGALGHRIVARLSGSGPYGPPLAVFTTFTRSGPLWSASRPVSPTAWLPCAAVGAVVFTPTPWSPGARTATVPVTFTPVTGVRQRAPGVVPGH